MSNIFVDSAGREWKFALDPFLITKVKNEVSYVVPGKKEHGLQLLAWDDNEFALAIRLRSDMPLLCDVLWALLDEQATKNGLNEAAQKNECLPVREFTRGLSDEKMWEALKALEVAIANFSPSLERATALRTLLNKDSQVMSILDQKRTKIIESLDPSQLAKSYMDSVSNGQPSPGSTSSVAASPSASSRSNKGPSKPSRGTKRRSSGRS